MSEQLWVRVSVPDGLPEKGRAIEWLAPSGGDPVRGKWIGGAVWMMDCGMYVYYTPAMWRYIPQAREAAAVPDRAMPPSVAPSAPARTGKMGAGA